MDHFGARQAFDFGNTKHELMARMACYKLIGLELGRLNSAILSVEYRIEIVPHEYLEHKRYVQIIATVESGVI